MDGQAHDGLDFEHHPRPLHSAEPLGMKALAERAQRLGQQLAREAASRIRSAEGPRTGSRSSSCRR